MRHETQSHRYFEREAGASACAKMNMQLGVLPIFKLVLTHPKLTAINSSEANIAAPYFEIAFLKTHGLRAIAAATTLVKHQIAETSFKLAYYL